jgi:hypothetical protein
MHVRTTLLDCAVNTTALTTHVHMQALSELKRQLWLRLGGCNAAGSDSTSSATSTAAAAASIPQQSPVALLMGLVRQPVAETRHGALDVLRCAAHQVGEHCMHNNCLRKCTY